MTSLPAFSQPFLREPNKKCGISGLGRASHGSQADLPRYWDRYNIAGIGSGIGKVGHTQTGGPGKQGGLWEFPKCKGRNLNVGGQGIFEGIVLAGTGLRGTGSAEKLPVSHTDAQVRWRSTEEGKSSKNREKASSEVGILPPGCLGAVLTSLPSFPQSLFPLKGKPPGLGLVSEGGAHPEVGEGFQNSNCSRAALKPPQPPKKPPGIWNLSDFPS